MVEINNQRKAFLDMLAWSEELIPTSENQKSWLWRHCRRRAIYHFYPITLKSCHANLKNLAPTGAGRYQLLSRWVGCFYRKQLGLKDSLRKVRTLWHCSRLRSVALYLWLIGDIRQATTAASAIWMFHCWALVMAVWSIRLTAWLQIQRRAERSQALMLSSHHDVRLFTRHRLPCRGLLIITGALPP